MTDSALFLKMFPFTTNQGVQPYKFGDKELDRMYGYDPLFPMIFLSKALI